MSKTFIIGTRGSKLALFQSNLVKEKLEKNYPEHNFELKKIKTKGDIMIDQVLDRKIDKGFFVNEMQKMLINEDIHIAVHSLKDLPVERHVRPAAHATVKATALNAMLAIMENHEKYDIFSYFLPTCPFVSPGDIKKGIEMLSPNINSVISMTEIPETIQLACVLSPEGHVMPIFDNLTSGLTNSKFIQKFKS